MAALKISIWKRAPFLLFLIPLPSGILLEWQINLFDGVRPITVLVGFVLFTLVMHLLVKKSGGFLNRYSAIEVFLPLFLLGFLLSFWHKDSLRENFSGTLLTDSSYVKTVLLTPLKETAKTWKAEVEITAIYTGSEVRSSKGKALLYFRKGTEKPDLSYGDELIIKNVFTPIKNSRNPGSFDYKRFNAVRNIYHQGYVYPGQWHVTKRQRGNPVQAFLLRTRQKGLEILDENISKSREAGIAKALLLGYREDLDPGLLEAYAHIGVVHLIAISGLHVGLIYGALLLLFFFFPKRLKKFKGGLILMLLWSFALLTGAHPSTLRATVMFSFLIIGRFFLYRETEPFNVLAASAFLLLCFQPFQLFDVGFQLSYLAVAGILIFQKPIENWFWIKNRVGNFVWKLLSVSIAAQILTFPLALFYFHQFPVVFLLSNLFLIPATSFALYGEVGLMVLHFFHLLESLFSLSLIPKLMHLLGEGITALLYIINESILWTDRFHFVRWEYFNLHFSKLVLLYGSILALSLWFFRRNKKAVLYALGFAAGLLLLANVDRWKALHQKKILVYQHSNHTLFELLDGRKAHLYMDSVEQDENFYTYISQPSQEVLGIKDRQMRPIDTSFFSFYGKRIAVIHNGFSSKNIQGELPVDYLILSRNNPFTMEQLRTHFKPSLVIFDSSVRYWQNEEWKTECNRLNLQFYSVPDNGAWIEDIE